MEYLIDHVASESILCLVTARTGESGPGAALLSALTGRRVATMVELARLGDQEIARVAEGCLPAVELPAALRRFLTVYADGLPFLVEELLAGMVADRVLTVAPDGTWSLTREIAFRVPPAFSETVRRRLLALSPAGVEVLHAAAILGRRFDWLLLVDAIGQPTQEVVATLRAAVGAQLVTADSDGFRFRHALTRDAVLDGVLPPERTELAHRLLESVERLHPGFPGAWCELAASLAEDAREPARSAGLLLQAGRRATVSGALDSAEGLLRRARALALDDAGPPSDAELAVRIEEAYTEMLALAGRVDEAFEVGDRLLAGLDPTSRMPADRVELHVRLARAAIAAARWKVAAEHLGAARTSITTDGGGPVAQVDALAAQVALGTGHLDEAEALAEIALREAELERLPAVACEALEVAGRIARQRDLRAAEAAFTRQLRTAAAQGLALWRLRALHELGTIDQLRTESVDRLVETRELAIEVGAVALVATLDLQIAAGLLKQFRGSEALSFARRSVDVSRRLGLATLPMALVLEATGYAQGGRTEEMEGCLAEALALAPDDADVLGSTWGHCRATTALLAEDRPRAVAEMTVGARSLRASAASIAPPFLGLRVLLLAVDDDPVVVRREIERLRSGGQTRHCIIESLLRYAESLLLGRAGCAAEAGSAFEDADGGMGELVAWYRQYARRVAAESAIDYGWGEPVPWLREAAGFFGDRGDVQLAAACRALLRRTGAAVPRPGRGRADLPTGLQALGVTSREAEVGELVSEGLTNAQIGEKLYLSPRTVEKHVAALLVKTGCRGRTQLAGYWARLPG